MNLALHDLRILNCNQWTRETGQLKSQKQTNKKKTNDEPAQFFDQQVLLPRSHLKLVRRKKVNQTHSTRFMLGL